MAQSIKPADKYAGSRIRAARKLAQMTQEGLAQKIGITFQQVQKYEHDTNRVSYSRLVEIAAVTQQPIAFFFADFGESEETTKMIAMLSDPRVVRFMKIVDRAPKSALNSAFVLLEELTGES